MKNKNEAPVLLITFNRANYTRQVFERIREAKIKKLYVANDAPRVGNKDDELNRNLIRKMLTEIDWDCELHTLFHDVNQGNGFGPVAALNWFFQNEEMGIILEDDMVPVMSFFDFCNHCLNKYKDDERVWVVSGVSHHSNHKSFNDKDYIFTRYSATCAWASWRRCWNKFDMNLESWPEFYRNGGYKNVFFDQKIGDFYNKSFDKYYHRSISSWDFRFLFTIASNSGFGIVPSANLIKNIGMLGAHSKGLITKSHKREVFHDFTFENEPEFVCLNRDYEIYHYEQNINPPKIPKFIKRVYNRMKIIIGKL